jgi:hypothetical protein
MYFGYLGVIFPPKISVFFRQLSVLKPISKYFLRSAKLKKIEHIQAPLDSF